MMHHVMIESTVWWLDPEYIHQDSIDCFQNAIKMDPMIHYLLFQVLNLGESVFETVKNASSCPFHWGIRFASGRIFVSTFLYVVAKTERVRAGNRIHDQARFVRIQLTALRGRVSLRFALQACMQPSLLVLRGSNRLS